MCYVCLIKWNLSVCYMCLIKCIEGCVSLQIYGAMSCHLVWSVGWGWAGVAP